jgi:hypothetical protein
MGERFERINYFKGMFMEAEDWQREQRYQLEKRRFHNRYLHTPGVAFGCLGNMKVTVVPEGNALTVAPGYAIDGSGNDLYLPEPMELKLPHLREYNPPVTLYVALRYNEREVDMRENEANPEYSGFAGTVEDTVVELTTQKPDNSERLELARIELPARPKHVKNADDATQPQPGEIDLRHVRGAGARTGTKIGKLSIYDLGDKVLDTKVKVRASSRKLESTNVLIEVIRGDAVQPMYIAHVESEDGVRIQWWIDCQREKGASEYMLNIKNYSGGLTTVICRVFRIRI